MDSAWIQRPVKLIQSDSDGVIIIQTDSDKFQKNSDRFSLIQNFLFMRVETIDPRGVAKFDPRGMIGIIYVEDH